ncbi:hypothetical protein RJ640_020659 [Escallonia rubra]|uniref:AT-rich interactive domain-containing protein 5 n=1 Tax=Escallonia rubra TaxID=112253 RepID=A0AA88RFZ3_9ASTE|nr:hypothetical protein RJ640_020659 [Escallonia rubra]
MDVKEVEREDTENLPQDSGDGKQGLTNNMVVANVEQVREEEESPGLAAANNQNNRRLGEEEQDDLKNGGNSHNSSEDDSDEGTESEDMEEEDSPIRDVGEEENPSQKREPSGDLPVNETRQNSMERSVDEPNEPICKSTAAAAEIPQSKNAGGNDFLANPVSTPKSLMKCSTVKTDHSGETSVVLYHDRKMIEEDETGTPQDQAAFMKELESFYRGRAMDFKPPKFYGQPLNLLKLWRAVIRLGGYERVTGTKLWRQVGESFHPPKTCTTVSWTFRIFYEKALLEYEKHKIQSGEVELPLPTLPEPSSTENETNGYQGPGSGGRARRDAAARAMQGWHAQRHYGYGEDKNFNSMPKREKSLKSIGSLKNKRPSEVEHVAKAARTELSKHCFSFTRLVTTVVDVGPPADWVKINVRENKDGFEVYALVPGLLREEVRVQSDPAGRLVITGQPEQPDNPWGITAFKKIVSLPARIDPLQTSAVVSLHGRLFVRLPFEHSNI